MVGIPNINANLDASFKFNPISNAAVIAVPDLDAPGMRAKHWNAPINNAVNNVISYIPLSDLFLKKTRSKLDEIEKKLKGK